MRTLITILSLATCFVSMPMAASAQTSAPSVTLEVQGRLGGGGLWVSSPSAVPGIESGNAVSVDLGASASVRHAPTGLGVTFGYAYAVTGVFDTFGLHELDLRLSERLPFARHGRFEASLLVEAGASYAFGGGSSSCAFAFDFSGTNACRPTHVDATLAGGVGALGVEFRYDAFLGGIELDYRHMVGVGSGGVGSSDELAGIARIGVAFDL